MEREPERADDAEVPAAAPQRPEQVGVIVGRCPNDVALGGDHLGLHEVVDGEPVLAHQPADAAAQAEAADAGVAHDAARGGQTVGLCLVVDVAPQGATLDEGGALDGIDRDGAHRREVDDDAVVAHCGAGHVVASASYGDLEVVVRVRSAPLRPRRRPRCSGRSVGVAGRPCRSTRRGRRRSHRGPGRSRAPEPGDLRWWLVLSSFLLWSMGPSQHRRAREEKSAIWTSKSGIWTSRRAGGAGHCNREDLRPVLPDRPRRRDLR